MANSQKASSAVAGRYAKALIELAEEKKALDKVAQDLQDLSAMIAGSQDLKLLIRSPMINGTKKEAAIGSLVDQAKFQDITKNFLGVLSRNQRLQDVESIIAAFSAALSKRRGEIAVNVVTAQDMSAKQKKDLEAAISKGVNAKVTVQAKVEPSILGGMIVTVGSHMIDDSVARKLERLKAAMSKESNENTGTDLKEVG